jgi:hypothetical protein
MIELDKSQEKSEKILHSRWRKPKIYPLSNKYSPFLNDQLTSMIDTRNSVITIVQTKMQRRISTLPVDVRLLFWLWMDIIKK